MDTGVTAPRRALHVLVVDDFEDTAESLALLLRYDGHQTDFAQSGSAALAIARARPPDVALLDIVMPDLSGYEVARELRTLLGQGVLLVAITVLESEEDKARGREAGFDVYFTKPADLRRLRALVREVAAWRARFTRGEGLGVAAPNGASDILSKSNRKKSIN